LLYFSKDKWFRYLFIGSVLWMLLESHKLCYTYSPTRYFVSSFFSVLLMISLVVWKLLLLKKNGILWRLLATAAIVYLLSLNLTEMYRSYNLRSFIIQDKNKLMVASISSEETYLGSIASSFNYVSKARAIPIFLGF